MRVAAWLAVGIGLFCLILPGQDRESTLRQVVELLATAPTTHGNRAATAKQIADLATDKSLSDVDQAQIRLVAAAVRDAPNPSYAQLEAQVRDLISRPPLNFKRSYDVPKLATPAAGGHASSPNAAPAPAATANDTAAIRSIEGVEFRFEDVPIELARTHFGSPTKDHILESAGGGVAILDYDGDGLQDIFIVHGPRLSPDKKIEWRPNALYRNLGNWRFVDVAEEAGVAAKAWGSGVCAGDYNGDGHVDLYVTTFGPNLLYRNNGDGTFTEVAAEAGVVEEGWSTGCAFLDSSGKGQLDLYVVGYVEATLDQVLTAKRTLLYRGGPLVMTGPVGLPGRSDAFYRYSGAGRFTRDSSALNGLVAAYGFGVVSFDANDDAMPDLYVANDSNPNFLFLNKGGRFQESALDSGVALSADGRGQAGMGVDAGDYDGDGLADIIVTNFSNDTNTIYRNLGKGQFEDVTEAAGLAARTYARMGWGVAFFDADLDGDQDIFIANGHIFPQIDEYTDLRESFRQRNQLLINAGGQFLDASDVAAASRPPSE